MGNDVRFFVKPQSESKGVVSVTEVLVGSLIPPHAFLLVCGAKSHVRVSVPDIS